MLTPFRRTPDFTSIVRVAAEADWEAEEGQMDMEAAEGTARKI